MSRAARLSAPSRRTHGSPRAQGWVRLSRSHCNRSMAAPRSTGARIRCCQSIGEVRENINRVATFLVLCCIQAGAWQAPAWIEDHVDYSNHIVALPNLFSRYRTQFGRCVLPCHLSLLMALLTTKLGHCRGRYRNETASL